MGERKHEEAQAYLLSTLDNLYQATSLTKNRGFTKAAHYIMEADYTHTDARNALYENQ